MAETSEPMIGDHEYAQHHIIAKATRLPEKMRPEAEAVVQDLEAALRALDSAG